MGLYLCIFDSDLELEGVEVGRYSDFLLFRSAVTRMLEGGVPGRKFPTLILHSDSDGEWSVVDCMSLRQELEVIAEEFRLLPPEPYQAEWQQNVAKQLGLKPSSLYESFIDVDGEPLLERLIHLCNVGIAQQRPILFQ